MLDTFQNLPSLSERQSFIYISTERGPNRVHNRSNLSLADCACRAQHLAQGELSRLPNQERAIGVLVAPDQMKETRVNDLIDRLDHVRNRRWVLPELLHID